MSNLFPYLLQTAIIIFAVAWAQYPFAPDYPGIVFYDDERVERERYERDCTGWWM